jgi:hypothetical protein
MWLRDKALKDQGGRQSQVNVHQFACDWRPHLYATGGPPGTICMLLAARRQRNSVRLAASRLLICMR